MLKKEQKIMRNKLQTTREVVGQLIFQRRNDELTEKDEIDRFFDAKAKDRTRTRLRVTLVR